MLHIPLILTFIRLVSAFFIFPVLLFYFWSPGLNTTNFLLALLLAFLCLTDFLDGYLARKFKQETTLGRVLDPVADKFLVYSTLVTLLALNKIYFFWVILLIGREFFVMSLRIISLERGFSLKVSYFAKLKTALQMIVLILIVLSPYTLQIEPLWHKLFMFFVLVSISFLTISTAFSYCINFFKRYND